MKEAESLAAFVAAPVGRYLVRATSVAWVDAPDLGGVVCWGRPDREAAQETLETFEALWAPGMAPRVHLVLDAGRVEAVLAESIALLVTWAARHRLTLIERIALQIGVIPGGIAGLALAGILSTFESTHAFRIAPGSREAMRRALPHDAARADRLSEEVEAIAARTVAAPRELVELGRLVRARVASLTLDEAASAIAVSSRSLQRLLQSRGTTFQDELRAARHEVASELLASTELKVAAVASRVGLSEQALTQLFRERTGDTPGAFRARARGDG